MSELDLSPSLATGAVSGFRLSPQQRRAWTSSARTGELCAAACPAELWLELRGPLEVARLEAALAAVIARHEVLRTDLRCTPGMRWPVQVVRTPAALPLHAEPGSSWEPAELSGVEALQARLFVQDPQCWWLLLRLPALFADGRSLRLLAAELAGAYSPVEEVGEDAANIQYADLAEWQNELLAGEDGAEGRRFWQHRLQRAEGHLPRLPLEQASDKQPRMRRAPVVAVDVTALAVQAGVRPGMVWLAIWGVLLARLTSRWEVQVACSYDGRSYEGLDRALGLLEHWLPVPLALVSHRGLKAQLGGVQESYEELYEWQEFFPPTERPPLPFACHLEEGAATWSAEDVTMRLLYHAAVPEPFLVRLNVVERVGCELELLFDAERLEPSSAGWLAEELVTLARQLVAQPELPLEQADLVGSAEAQLLRHWSFSAELPVAEGRDVLSRFAEQVRQQPDKLAVTCGSDELSFRQLATAVGRLACELRRRGVGADRVVALYLERSWQLVVAILAVLRAGGAYLPLDPGYPRERVRKMLESSGAGLLLTRAEELPELPESAPEVLVLDDSLRIAGDEGDRASLSPQSGWPEPVAASLAYLMFTSGSTGEPKGVMLTHGAVASYAEALPRALGLSGDDVYLCTASFAFSSSVRQLLVPLVLGATVVVATRQERTEPALLLALLHRCGVTVMDTVPSFWRSCLEASRHASGGRKRCDLRLALSTGEPLTPEIPRAWVQHFTQPVCFVNMYGQTETTGMVAVHALAAGDLGGERRPPLGRPVPNSRLYVLDRQLRPVPVGGVGELHVAGTALGRGYLHRPALTADRFRPDPHGAVAGSRLFRTGDLGHFDGEGRLHFVGRIDYQVQVRGFRVEPGEVEAVLVQHASVARCAVAARGELGDQQLIAWVVPRTPGELAIRSLRLLLEQRLPPYLVPSRFVLLDELPTTPNGKTDYRALPAPQAAEERAYVPPRTPLEKQLAEIWAEVLEVERVGLQDDFFELGGHSMRGILIMARVQEQLGVDIPAYKLLELRTVAELAQLVAEMQLSGVSEEDLADALAELAELSDQEVQAQLAEEP